MREGAEPEDEMPDYLKPFNQDAEWEDTLGPGMDLEEDDPGGMMDRVEKEGKT